MPSVKLDLGQSIFSTADPTIQFSTDATIYLDTDRDHTMSGFTIASLLKDQDSWFRRSVSIRLSFEFMFSSWLIWNTEHDQHPEQQIINLLQEVKLWRQLGLHFRPCENQTSIELSNRSGFTIHGELKEATGSSFQPSNALGGADLTNVRTPETVLNYEVRSIAVKWTFFGVEGSVSMLKSYDSVLPDARVIQHSIISSATVVGLRKIIGLPAMKRSTAQCKSEQHTLGLMDLLPSIFKPGFAERVSQRTGLAGTVSYFLTRFSNAYRANKPESKLQMTHARIAGTRQTSEMVSHHVWMTMTNSLSDREPAFRLQISPQECQPRQRPQMTRDIESTSNIMANLSRNICPLPGPCCSDTFVSLLQNTQAYVEPWTHDLLSLDGAHFQENCYQDSQTPLSVTETASIRCHDLDHSKYYISTDHLLEVDNEDMLFGETEQPHVNESIILGFDTADLRFSQHGFRSRMSLEDATILPSISATEVPDSQVFNDDDDSSVSDDLVAEFDRSQSSSLMGTLGTINGYHQGLDTSHEAFAWRVDPASRSKEMLLSQ